MLEGLNPGRDGSFGDVCGFILLKGNKEKPFPFLKRLHPQEKKPLDISLGRGVCPLPGHDTRVWPKQGMVIGSNEDAPLVLSWVFEMIPETGHRTCLFNVVHES